MMYTVLKVNGKRQTSDRKNMEIWDMWECGKCAVSLQPRKLWFNAVNQQFILVYQAKKNLPSSLRLMGFSQIFRNEGFEVFGLS